MRYKQRSFPREERKQQVIGQFNVWHANGDNQPKTMGRIARALDLTPSPHFRDILLEMESEGRLTANPRGEDGKFTVRHYSLVKTLITEKYGKRRINVKRQGQVVGSLEVPAGQMSLWSRESKTSWENDYEWDLRERAKSTTGENLAREHYMDVNP